MPVDNTIYDRLSHTWWDEDVLPAVLRTGANPARFGYMKRVLTQQLRIDPVGLEVLDVGCGVGEQLPHANASFDAVYCCDVLEHVDHVGRTVREIARVLRPGGVFLYDTINRALRSRLLVIKLSQDWAATRWAEPNTHDWRCFIRPSELERELVAVGLDVRDRVGLAPANPFEAVRAMRARVRGVITYGELGRRLRLREGRDMSALYAGYAVKHSA